MPRSLLLLALLLAAASPADPLEVKEEFAGARLPPEWRVSSPAWVPSEGALRGRGSGHLDLLLPFAGDFDLAFEGECSGKANVEALLLDPASGEARMTFAFLGRYHSVLDGVKSCILRDQRFVDVSPRTWIWPGRRFRFRVRREGPVVSMSLDGVAGPAWTDPSPPGPGEGRRLRIAVSTESAEAEVLLDAVHLRASAVQEAGAGGEAPPAPAPAPAPDDPAAAPAVETAKTRNVLLVNHGDPSLVLAGIAGDLQRQYDWLREWVGAAPERVAVHVAPGYPCGFARPGDPSPEMFLREGPIFDTSNDYAHEMLHCFLFRYGDLPHWFGESMADMAWADAEIGLWKRRKEEFVRTFSRPDHRSHELGVLRAKYGREFFPRVCRLLEKGRARGLAVFRPGVPPAERNGLLLSILSEAAGEDLRPLFTGTLGFDPDTRERQRGY